MMEESKNKFNSKLRSIIFSKDTPIFLFFLLLATIFWFIQSLDKQRTTSIKVPIRYIGLSDEIEIEQELPSNLEVRIKDEGAAILKYKRNDIVPLALELDKNFEDKGRIIISSDQLKSRLAQYVFPTTSILSIKPDSISSNYYKLNYKTVPVRLSSNIKIANQYVLRQDISIEPKQVKVYGPKNVIDTLSAIYTKKYEGRSINKDSSYVALKLDNSNKQLKLSEEEVNVGVFVEMFTENKFEAPIILKNVPNNVTVRLFPNSATISYNVKMSDFNKVSERDVRLIFDYNEAIELKKREYNLQTEIKTDKIWSVRSNPSKVEFLLEKRD